MDNKLETFPTLLDGNVVIRGQGQEGNSTSLAQIEQDGFHEYVSALRKEYSFYICMPGCMLTDEDYQTLWLDESERSLRMLTPQQRVIHFDRLHQVNEKIDFERTHFAMEKALYNQRLNAKKSNHAGHELGAREFTFTYSPKWFSDEEARDLMKKAISKLIKYYSEDIVQLRAVGEVGSNGLSHVHCFYKLRGGLKISDKNFKRAYKYWNPKKVTSRTGHEGGHHANVRVESDFQGYIDKDVDIAWMDIYYPQVDPTA